MKTDFVHFQNEHEMDNLLKLPIQFKVGEKKLFKERIRSINIFKNMNFCFNKI